MISPAKLVLIESILAAVSIFAFLRFGNELSNFLTTKNSGLWYAIICFR